jgi:cytidylate kinase
MYRAVTYFLRESSVDISSEAHVRKMLDILNLELDFTSEDEIKIILDNKDISTLIRSKEITSAVSEVSAIKAVREKMVKIQKDTVKNGNFIVEGRDIGTVVFPDAKYKFFLTADYDVRAQRRLEDFKRVNEELNVNKIKQDLTDRDQYDSSRKLSPLKQAKDAFVIDTSACTIDDQVNQIFKHIERN